ncbi:MAG: hypothetical protein WA539_03610 [Candidatus Sulfotelmatobacter sp.]
MLVLPSVLSGRQKPTVAELKDRLADTRIADRPKLCLRISERQLDAVDRFYVAGDSVQAKAALADVVNFSELARDYAIKSRKHEKQSEITIRKMVRNLDDLMHTISPADQKQVQIAIDRLQRVRDDLLGAMFPESGDK